MRKELIASPASARASEPEHALVRELREAMAKKDIVTMGRMLELLGSIKAELVAGGPAIAKIDIAKNEPGANNAAATAAPPVRSLSARLARAGRAA